MALYKIDKDAQGQPTGDLDLIAGGTLWADAPIGTIFPFLSSSIPAGFLLCDGTTYSATDYPELWAILPSTVKNTTNNTFTIDLRETTLKGAGLTGETVGNHLDADGLAVGEFLDDRLQDWRGTGKWRTFAPADTQGWDFISQSASGSAINGRYGATTEVKSRGVNFIIKAKMIAVPADFMAKVDEAVEDVYGDIIPSGASASNKLVTKNNIFFIGDRRDIIGWADLSNSVTIDGSSNYANNIGRIEGHNAIIQVSNPTIGYQWPITNSGDSNKFIDLGSSLQFFIDKVNNRLYVRYSDSTDMSRWEEIATKKYSITGSDMSFENCRSTLGLSYPCRFKFEFFATDNSCYLEGYAYRESASTAPTRTYVGTSGYVIYTNATGTIACYTSSGSVNVPGTFICTEIKD